MHTFLLVAALCADPDIEAMKRSLEAQIGLYQRINDLEKRVTKLEKGDAKPVVGSGSGAGQTPFVVTAPELPKTTVCQCQGYRESVCHCRKHGQVCHCTRTSGSVWALNEQGQATHKTGAKADPQVAKPAAKPVPAPVLRPAERMIRIQPSTGGYCPNCRSGGFDSDD